MGDMDDGLPWVGDERLVPRRDSKDAVGRAIDHMDERVSTKAFSNARAVGLTEVRDVIAVYLEDHVLAERFASCIEILRRKNADYSQGEQRRDRIAAFKRIARDIELPVRKAWAVFAQKHWGAIMRYVKDGRVDSEPIEGRIDDMINYLVLFASIVDWEQRSEGSDSAGKGHP